MAARPVKENFMGLRKSPERTPAFLAAHRRNAQKCTGPKTPKGKARSSLNALKHGRFARNLPAKLRTAGVREAVRVFNFRKQSSRLYPGKAGQILTERSANTLAVAVWREHKTRRKRPHSPLFSQEGSQRSYGRPSADPSARRKDKDARETRVPKRDEVSGQARAAIAKGTPIITPEQLDKIRLKFLQSAEKNGGEE